jgi:3D (Asp-Asp-Asp) domain-containing protein
MTRAATVGGLLAESKIPVAPGDVVSPAPGAELPTGGTVVVRHAVPVSLRLGAVKVDLRVVGTTVADAFVAAGIDPFSGVRVTPALNAPLRRGMTVTALETWVKVWSSTYRVPIRTLVREDEHLDAGKRVVRCVGRTGLGVRMYRAVVIRGKAGPATLTSNKVTVAPVDRIICVGIKHVADRDSVSGAVLKPASYAVTVPPAPAAGTRITVEATAYSPNHGCGTRTRTGMIAGYGIIAVDPRIIPLGTRLYVPGYGYGLAADTGGAIKGGRIDVCYDHEWQCERWGRQTLTVILLP